VPDPNAGDINNPRGVILVANPIKIMQTPGKINAAANVSLGISLLTVALTTDSDMMLGKALQAPLMVGGTARSTKGNMLENHHNVNPREMKIQLTVGSLLKTSGRKIAVHTGTDRTATMKFAKTRVTIEITTYRVHVNLVCR
jgi:hypothetical protein